MTKCRPHLVMQMLNIFFAHPTDLLEFDQVIYDQFLRVRVYLYIIINNIQKPHNTVPLS